MTSIPIAKCRFCNNKFEHIYLKKERLFLDFFCVSEMCMKLRIFWEKKGYPSLIITEIIASERDIYLSV